MQMKFALDLKDHKFHMRHVGLVLNAAVTINAAKHQHPFMSTENASVNCNNYTIRHCSGTDSCSSSCSNAVWGKINDSENLFCRMRVKCVRIALE